MTKTKTIQKLNKLIDNLIIQGEIGTAECKRLMKMHKTVRDN